MQFDWDDDKNRSNIDKHGLSFSLAMRIFEGPVLSVVDDRFDYGETRVVSVGAVDNLLVIVVVHTDRQGIIRIISARPAKRSERSRYAQALRQGTQPR